PLTMDAARFAMFIATEIFPGGQLPAIEAVEEQATAARFTVTRIQSLQSHYARTLQTWAKALEAQRDEAVAVQSEEVYQRYLKYLTGCADMFRDGYIDVNQFTLQK
ncbi:MAG: cyclopropane-fatty-acyl-phospholipid synthase, partial [Mycobacterium sp.]|nr:cyclopropane-fatty-acyl-phospholipid synthase [Mycobacterium sp.]